MSRTQRLFELIQILRNHRYPVTGAYLATELGISLRTLYRDIAELQQQGADIEGAAGLGYVLRSGFMLPPLMFSEDEIEALVLGSRWVAKRTDNPLASAAQQALTKIANVLPDDLKNILENSNLLIGSSADVLDENTKVENAILPVIRQAIRSEQKIEIDYEDGNGRPSSRIVWPFALGYFEHVRVLVAWCELRQSFRHFRTDRISALFISEQRYPQRRQALLKQWRISEGISLQ